MKRKDNVVSHFLRVPYFFPLFPPLPSSTTHCSLNYSVTQINPFFSVQWLDNKSEIYCSKWIIKNELAENKQKAACVAIFCVNQNLEDRSEINIWLGDEKKQSFPLRVGEEEDQKNDKENEKGRSVSSKVAKGNFYWVLWWVILGRPPLCLRNDSIFCAHIKVQLDCLIEGRRPSVSILQIIYIIDFQASLKERGIYHPNCGRQSVCHCRFIKIMVNRHLDFFFPVFSLISFHLYMSLHFPMGPNTGIYMLFSCGWKGKTCLPVW